MLAASAAACAPRPTPDVAPGLSADAVAARLAHADRLASRGCYLCLKEAFAAYDSLLADSGSDAAAAGALEVGLMLALRERELRIPDSGVRDAIRELQARVSESYAGYRALVDSWPSARQELLALVRDLEARSLEGPMHADFYLAAAQQSHRLDDVRAHVDAALQAHPEHLALAYRMLTFSQFSREAARDLIGQETGFAEVHYLLGQQDVMDGRLADAFRELTRARQMLPDSASITFVLANVTFAYARYADALTLYDHVQANEAAGPLAPQARLGRARALSYLKHHAEAIALLDELLLTDARNSPGDKFYWRAWNRLQLGDSQAAYDDAQAGLNAMRNDAIYRLAGIASFNLGRHAEARGFFDEALRMNPDDCDSQRYLGLVDAADRNWKPAGARFAASVACYDESIRQMKKELAGFEEDITGLSNGLIAAKRFEIASAEALRAQAAQNIEAAARNAR